MKRGIPPDSSTLVRPFHIERVFAAARSLAELIIWLPASYLAISFLRNKYQSTKVYLVYLILLTRLKQTLSSATPAVATIMRNFHASPKI